MYLKIENKQELFLFINTIEKADLNWIAIDTEFHRETTYFPILSLIQIATEDQIWIIDAIHCDDLSSLKNLLENKKIKKIFHAGDQDWTILKQKIGAITWPFIDTQYMAAFAKLGHSKSLESLVSKLLENPIDKSQQKTNWLGRPLTEKQLEYAAQDAAYVAKIYPILAKTLEELERTAWVDQEMENLRDKYNNNGPSKDWLKLCPKGSKWPAPYFAIELARWREEIAINLDLPKRHVISDTTLEKILKNKNLEHITQDNCHKQAVAALKIKWQELNSKAQSPVDEKQEILRILKNHHQDFSPQERKALKFWQGRVKKISEELGIPGHLILNKQHLQQLVSGDTSPTLGWKREFLGFAS